ncbi:hypothetical protein MRB53_018951 [Persea americana]|uniref:Uncharacterized protein n=1 Tax=Persea americana TaxID=3435 RepID=A0ACC2MAS9_PERAE|nr:hypothetical protein MRB53_018951 [Persea americana]
MNGNHRMTNDVWLTGHAGIKRLMSGVALKCRNYLFLVINVGNVGDDRLWGGLRGQVPIVIKAKAVQESLRDMLLEVQLRPFRNYRQLGGMSVPPENIHRPRQQR